MKKILLVAFALILQFSLSAQCSYSSGIVEIDAAIAASCPTLEITGEAILVINGDVTINNTTWNIAPSAKVEINGSLILQNGARINNNGTFDVVGSAKADAEFTMASTATFVNNGRFNVIDADFTTNNAKFENKNTAVVVVNNDEGSNKTVNLGTSIKASNMVSGSKFIVNNADVYITIGKNNEEVATEIFVYDADLWLERVADENGNVKPNVTGKLYVVDTKGEKNKGVIHLPYVDTSNSSSQITYTINGNIYATDLDNPGNYHHINENGDGNIVIEVECPAGICDDNGMKDEINDTENEFLPIELSTFTVQATAEGAIVTWTTLSEKNNDYFTILRSSDGHVFEEIAHISAAGTSKTTVDYSFFDENPYSGISYYRLAQTDIDGTVTLHHIIPVYFYTTQKSFTVSTQNCNGLTALHCNFYATDYTNAIYIYSLSGELQYTQSIDAGIAQHSIELPVKSGVYIITHVYNGYTTSIKTILQ
jgi:hypothetical protein